MNASTRRYKDIKLLYSSDFIPYEKVVRQRIYSNEDGAIQTPITPLIQARAVPGSAKAPRAKDFQERYTESCFFNPDNTLQESRFRNIIPYAPSDSNFLNCIIEIKQFPGVLSVSYKGETHTKNLENFL